jgi:hypothetical protein
MLYRDPPSHTLARTRYQAFTPRVIERMRNHIQDIMPIAASVSGRRTSPGASMPLACPPATKL